MGRLTPRQLLVIALAVAVVPAVLVLRAWTAKGALKGQAPAEPFRIAGNFYYVGASDISSFLLTGPEGHVLIGAGYPTTAPMTLHSIATLGFDIKDVKVLLSASADVATAGALSAFQQASGAELWTSEGNADILASGGYDPAVALPLRVAMSAGLLRYQPPRVDHRLKDGDTIRLGPIAITAHDTPGTARSCTSWSFPVRDGDRVLNVVSACELLRAMGSRYPEQDADLERSFRVLRGLPADIWVTSHARKWGRYRKFTASQTATDPVEPFVDPTGYRAYIDDAEDELRRGVVH